jgi:hypothetical protein
LFAGLEHLSALSSLKIDVDSFRSIYVLNAGIYALNASIAANTAVATGRYSEDLYMGGTYSLSTKTFTTLTSAIKSFAGGFLEFQAKYTVRA